jgi:hypothetical protein
LEEGSKPGRRVLGKADSLTAAHEEVSGQRVTYAGKICSITDDRVVVEDAALIEGQFQFIHLVQLWHEFEVCWQNVATELIP